MKPKHTPVPWNGSDKSGRVEALTAAGTVGVAFCGESMTCTPEGYYSVSRDEALANASFIAHACNLHEELVGALKEAVALLRTCSEQHPVPRLDSLRAVITKAEKSER